MHSIILIPSYMKTFSWIKKGSQMSKTWQLLKAEDQNKPCFSAWLPKTVGTEGQGPHYGTSKPQEQKKKSPHCQYLHEHDIHMAMYR